MKEKGEVAQYKKLIVKDLVTLFDKYPIIGAVNMENLPALQLQRIRKALQGKVILFMTKRRYIKIAIEASKVKGIKNLVPYLKGMPALLFTSEDPFLLAKILQKNKSKAAIKPGQIAPNDLVVKAGVTPFAPGPVIGELGSLGIKTSIENGKVAIANDSVVVKEGEEASQKAAGILSRLGVEPVEIGLNLTAVLENGEIITPDVLFVDEQEYIDKIALAHAQSVGVCLEIGYTTEDTIKILIGRAHQKAYSVAMEAEYMTDATAEALLAKAKHAAETVQALSGGT